MLERLLQWDRETFLYLNDLGVAEYDFFWSTATKISSWTPLFLIFFIVIYRKYPKREVTYVILSIVALIFFITLATDVTKEIVGRLRPNNEPEINSLIRILRNPTSYSFFSGHASSSFSITTLVVLFLRKRFQWCWLFYIWPIVFAYSRIYVGVHYPLDILVGAVVGVLSAFLFYTLYVRLIVPYLRLGHP